MKRSIVLAIVALASCGRSQLPTATIASSLPASYTHHRTFQYLGKKQLFGVPANVTSIFIVTIGGEGGGSPVAHAGRVSAVLPVTSGELLYVRVGGSGTLKAAGYNGGGAPGANANSRFNGYGGGGASDVRQGGDTLEDRILVAGGGGGQGGFDAMRESRSFGVGGKGGGRTGGAGEAGYLNYSSTACAHNYAGCGGGGGTQKLGGAGGVGGYGECRGNDGSAGGLGVGGTGAVNASTSYGGCSGLGGGGGGGYYGGGGGGQGGAETSYLGGGGGGGGGSSYAERSARNVHMWQGWNKDEYSLIVFSW